jgi:23S rRNA pseudouridine1911/1915/1917 synthase
VPDRVHWTAEAADAGVRLDAFLAGKMEKTRSAVQKLIEQGNVLVNGSAAAKNARLREGDQVEAEIPPPETLDVKPQNIPLDIVYEDGELLVVNKPKGMVVHPAAGNPDGTLVNALLFHCGESLSGINGVIRPGIVHRIDKDTSGLLIVAKNDRAHQSLAEQIAAHSFTRIYNAVVYGSLKEEKGTVSAAIGRHPSDRKRMAVLSSGGREAVTHYRVLERFPGFTLVECRLETGRTHQIRVHMAHIGHPVAGDPVYGPKRCITELRGQCLHARVIGFVHPSTGEYLEFDSGLPAYFEQFLAKLRRG